MAKLVPRFRANVMRIRHQFIPKKEVEVANQKQKDGRGVPLPPRMVFNRDGSPCYKHLEEEEPVTETKKVKGKDGLEFYIAPRINWRKEA